MDKTPNDTTFVNKVKTCYPEGLTAVISPGGTRSAYILAYNRKNKNPGKIEFADYAEKTFGLYCQLLLNFFDLGVQNIIDANPPLSLVLSRSPEYIDKMIAYYLTYISQPMQESYKNLQIDPYFVGLEAILNTNPDSKLYQYAKLLSDFMQSWTYSPNNKKLIFEICPVPLYSLWSCFQKMSITEKEHLDAKLKPNTGLDLNQTHHILYNYFIKATYGFQLPPPHFTLSTNVKGSCKSYLSIPSVFSSGINMNYFYTPYSPVYINREGVKKIIGDLIEPKKTVSKDIDYRNHALSSEIMEQDYLQMEALINSPNAIIGLTK